MAFLFAAAGFCVAWINVQHKALLPACIEQLAKELKQGFYEGISIPGRGLFFLATIGAKGDLKWFARAAGLSRSFEHLGKKNDLEMCHECEAESILNPWEDASTDSTCWVGTGFNTRPWSWSSPPALANIPCDLDPPEKQLRKDVFHLCKVEIYRDFTSCAKCATLLLIMFGYFGQRGQLDEKLGAAHQNFKLFCQTKKRAQTTEF